MKRKPLIETNPYLKSPDKYRKALLTNVSISTAIETGESVESIIRTLTGVGKRKPSKKLRGAGR